MQQENIKVELTMNGVNVQVGHSFLEDISRDIPDIKENKKVFEILAKSDDFKVRRNVAYKDNLNKNTIDILLQDSDMEVVDSILSNRDAPKFITQEQLQRIIDLDNIILLETIGNRIDNYASCNTCKIINKLVKYPNARVRASLFRVFSSLNIKQLEILSQDSDSEIASEAKKELKDKKS